MSEVYNRSNESFNPKENIPNALKIDYVGITDLLKRNKELETKENVDLDSTINSNLENVYNVNLSYNRNDSKKYINDLPLEDNSYLFAGLIKVGGIIGSPFLSKIWEKLKLFFRNKNEIKVGENLASKSNDIDLSLKGKTPETIGGINSHEQLVKFLDDIKGLSPLEKEKYKLLVNNKVEKAELKLINKGILSSEDKIIINGKEYIVENGSTGVFDLFSKLDGTKRKEILLALEKSGLDEKIYTILYLDNLKYGMERIAETGNLSAMKTLFRGNNIGNLDKKILNDIAKDKIGQQKLDNILDIFDDLVEKTRNKQELTDVRDGLFQLRKSIKDNSQYYKNTNDIINNINLKLNN